MRKPATSLGVQMCRAGGLLLQSLDTKSCLLSLEEHAGLYPARQKQLLLDGGGMRPEAQGHGFTKKQRS